MSNVARSSGLLTADGQIHVGRCKLVSIHACNMHAADHATVVIYDNTAASGKIVAKFVLPPLTTAGGDALNPTLEFDMHGVICRKGLYIDVTGGTPNVTVEFA
tara:strand:- start:87 stop:395 length:309 start_codon:yes stop_codon:yes gene_type:complete